MTILTGKSGHINFREVSSASDGSDLDGQTTYQDVAIFNWNLTWGYDDAQHYWASPAENKPYSLKGISVGTLNFSFLGCDPPGELLASNYGYLKFRLFYTATKYYLIYAKARSFTMNWSYKQRGEITTRTDAYFDLVLHSPSAQVWNDDLAEITKTIQCSTNTCSIGDPLIDDIELPGVKNVSLEVSYSNFDYAFAYDLLTLSILKGKQPNRGTIDARMSIIFQDELEERIVDVGSTYKITLPTSVGFEWILEWMRMKSIENFVVDPQTGRLIEVTGVYQYTHNMNANARIYTPSGLYL